MKIEQFADFIKPSVKRPLEAENADYKSFLVMNEMAAGIVHRLSNEKSDLISYRDASRAVGTILHKIRLAFAFGYLALNDGLIGNKDERIALYTEIAEYLDLVAAGIDSFVATHPIRAIEEGASDD